MTPLVSVISGAMLMISGFDFQDLNTLCRQVNDPMDIFLDELIKFYLNNMVNLHQLTPHIMVSLYPKNGDRIVTIDTVTSLHPMYFANFDGIRQQLNERDGQTLISAWRRERLLLVPVRYCECILVHLVVATVITDAAILSSAGRSMPLP